MESPHILLCGCQIVAEGLRFLLQREFLIGDVVHTAADALKKTVASNPAFLLIETAVPDALSIMLRVRTQAPRVKVIVLGVQEDRASVRIALRNGVHGIVLKTDPVEALLAAIRRTSRGERYLSPALEHELMEVTSNRLMTSEEPDFGFTDRQLQVLHLVAKGKTLREIGEDLCISTKTAEFHKASLMHRLGLRTSADLIRFAFEQKLVTTSA